MQPIKTIVSTEWLAMHLGEPDLRLVDATWRVLHPVGASVTSWAVSSPRVAFTQAHIPGAVFFDLDEIADTEASLPQTLPPAEQFERFISELGIGNGDYVIVYGTYNLIASARVWWMFRVFSHERVAVLDGGFPKWQAEGRPLESNTPTPTPRRFTAHCRPGLVADLERVRANLTSQRAQVLDARSPGRFAGAEPERRPGLRGGHIPGSLNLPYERLFETENGTLLPTEALQRTFEAVGLDVARPVISTCGTGVSGLPPIRWTPSIRGSMCPWSDERGGGLRRIPGAVRMDVQVVEAR